jgi:hypothetical protein
MPVEWVILAVSLSHTKQASEPGWLRRYNDQLWAGRSGVKKYAITGAQNWTFLDEMNTQEHYFEK